MATRKLPHLAKRMRWTARIICLIVTVFGATMLIGEAVTEFISQGFVTTSTESGLLVMIGLVALAGKKIVPVSSHKRTKPGDTRKTVPAKGHRRSTPG